MREEGIVPERAVTRGHAMLLLNHADVLVPASDQVFQVVALPVSWTLAHCEGLVLRLDARPSPDGVIIVPSNFIPGDWEEKFIMWVYEVIAGRARWQFRRVLIDEAAADMAAEREDPFAGEDEYDPDDARPRTEGRTPVVRVDEDEFDSDLDHHRDRQAQLP